MSIVITKITKINSLILYLVFFVFLYIDLSFFDHLDLLRNPPSDNKFYNYLFVIFTIIFIITSTILFLKAETILKNKHIFRFSFNTINNILFSYYIIIFIIIIIISFQITIENKYNVYYIYIALIMSHIVALFFSISGSIKFLTWLKKGKEILSIIYLISFISFSILITSSLFYHLIELTKSQIDVSYINYYKKIQTIAQEIPFIYKVYIYAYIFSFFSIWVSVFFLLHGYVTKNRFKLFVILLVPLILFSIDIFPIFVDFIFYIISIYPNLFYVYMLFSTLSPFIGPIIFGGSILLIIKNTNNKNFKNYLLPISFGLFLFFTSTQSNLFSQILYPPFGLITLLFSGVSVYLIFIGFYYTSEYISRNYYLVKDFVDKYYQFTFFNNIAKVEVEKKAQKVFTEIQKNDEFDLTDQPGLKELNKEQIDSIIQLIREEFERN